MSSSHPSAPDTPQEKGRALTRQIIVRLGRNVDEDDLVLWVCDQTGLDWPAAHSLVENIKLDHYREIGRRRKPLLVALQILITIIGVILTVTPLLFWDLIVQLDGNNPAQTIHRFKLAFDNAGGWIMVVMGAGLLVTAGWLQRQKYQQ
ncbi:MAG TPA: hypothetical protein PKG95_01950 [Anaerolineaceae bacterium]|nr:hypothetical protein [Anaerolineaceae bacterium]